MRRLRWSMILGALALAFTGCLSLAPEGADSTIDEVQSATSLDRTAATDPDQVAAEFATPAAFHGPLPFDITTGVALALALGAITLTTPSTPTKADPASCTNVTASMNVNIGYVMDSTQSISNRVLAMT